MTHDSCLGVVHSNVRVRFRFWRCTQQSLRRQHVAAPHKNVGRVRRARVQHSHPVRVQQVRKLGHETGFVCKLADRKHIPARDFTSILTQMIRATIQRPEI